MENHYSLDLSHYFPSNSFYQCPCRRVYKSYPALYTHIKNKHSGKAPGPIKKPALLSKKRERISTSKSLNSIESCSLLLTQNNIINSSTLKFQSNGQYITLSPKECISNIVLILEKLPIQDIDTTHLYQMEAIMEMSVYISAGKRASGSKLVQLLTQFFSELSKEASWGKFKHFYTLLMVFLQFVLVQTNHVKNIEQLSPDSLCHYINNYISFGVDQITKLYKLDNLAIFKQDIMLNLLELFFKWTLEKEYTSYRITLNKDFHI